MILSEFMAANTRTRVDDHREFSDWIELRNVGNAPVDLAGWTLSASTRKPTAWPLPATNLPPDGLILIWASGRDQRNPAHPLHTDFRLDRDGDYLALRRPDGTTASEFAPKYPRQWPDASFGFLPGSTQAVLFTSPTPGRPNESTRTRPGPFITGVSHSPTQPKPGENVIVTATLATAASEKTRVTLFWRIMFQGEESIEMSPSGKGRWTALLPLDRTAAGQMVRWRIAAQDESQGRSQYPPATDPKRTSRYLGLLVTPGPLDTPLPVYHLFLAPKDLERAESEQGAYGCLQHDGEFYDNVFVKVRGNSTAFFPKKSHRLEFPVDHPLRHAGPGKRIRHTSFMAEFLDPTYLRQHLSFWLQAKTGSAAPFHDPVRIQLNGEFWQLAMHSEVLGEDLLERHGLDPNGSLYKAVGTLTTDFSSTGGFEKKTRRKEGVEDYLELAQALDDDQSVAARRRALFDRMNLPATINYLAVARLTQEDDDIWANMSLYHDNVGTDEWRPIPFDMNVSWGLSFAHGGILATEDRFRSHPFFGASNSGMTQGHNRLYDAVVAVPETRQMLLRRMRTVLDQWWQPPGTPMEQRLIEQHIAVMARLMSKDAALDRERWNGPRSRRNPGATGGLMEAGIQDLIQQFIEPRRRHFYVTHAASSAGLFRGIGITASHVAGIPGPQTASPRLDIVRAVTHPTQPELDHVILTNPNPDAVDLSGWQLQGRVTYTFPSGTVLPTKGKLHVAADLRAFRTRLPSPPSDPFRFVVGNFQGRLTGDKPLTLLDARSQRIAGLAP